MTTAHSVARPAEIEMDPTPNSFRGIDLEDTEDQNELRVRLIIRLTRRRLVTLRWVLTLGLITMRHVLILGLTLRYILILRLILGAY